MKRYTRQIMLGAALVTLSIVLYSLHFLLFHDAHHIFIYMVGDIAFVPVEVLMVTLIIHRILDHREKQALLHKLNMVIGAYHTEVGTQLLGLLTEYLTNADAITPALRFTVRWDDADFARAGQAITTDTCRMDSRRRDLTELRDFLATRRVFLLRLLENPNLLEHDAFTDLLWAVSHLGEELSHRDRLTDLPEPDLDHLSGDMKRAYVLLLNQWLQYMNHLRKEYPYLYSIAVRTNPFDPEAEVIIS
jgi:hypothetical protein